MTQGSPALLKPGFYPFWFWNDLLTEDEIRWQIGEMAAQGIKGFFIHSRQGLQQPYLSEEFFQMVAVAVEAAKEHRLWVHLYDEYPYPSGVAGGEVILGNPQFYATALAQKTFDVPGGAVSLPLPRGQVLNCTIYPLHEGKVDWTEGRDARNHVGMVLTDESYNEMGLTRYNQKRYFASNPTPTLAITLPSGSYRVFVSVQTVVETHKYWKHFVDVLNPDAVAAFLRLTHERYYQRFSAEFGGVIYSIFIDETEPGWSARLPEAFKKKYGYALLPLLPALQDTCHPEHLKVSEALARLKYEMFCRTFEEPIARWCADHGLRYTGEKPSLRLAQLRCMDIPGCDAGHTKAGAKMDLLGTAIRGNARAAASAAYFYGKEGALCEAYHSLGWSATLQDIKLIAEGLLLLGVPFLVPHGFFYSTHALKKHDAPPTFFFQMPYWELFHHLSRRVDCLAKHLEGAYINAQVLVVEPAAGLPTRRDLEAYGSLLDILMEEHIEFLLVDTDILQAGTLGEGTLQIRDVAARVVLVPPIQVLETPLRLRLEEFEQTGGTVIHYDPAADRDELVARLLALAPPTLKIQAVSGDAAQVQATSRRRDGKHLWFLLNTGSGPVELALEADCPLKELPLDDAQPILPAQAENRQHGTSYFRTLAPFEGLLLEEKQAEAAVQSPVPALPARVSVSLQNSMTITARNKNLLRMYDWEMTLGDKGGSGQETATVPAIPLANQLEKGGFRFSPTIFQSFGTMPELRLPPLHLTYRFGFDLAFNGLVELVMEPGSLSGRWQIQVNEQPPFQEARFVPTASHVRGSLGVEIGYLLRPGRNMVTVEVWTNNLSGGLRNALYLAGDFGVEINPSRLVSRRLTGAFEDWEANLLPFYAGVVEYETEFELAALPPSETILAEFQDDRLRQAAYQLSFNECPWRELLWTPHSVCLPREELRIGVNRLVIRAYTSLARAFEGQWFDPAEHRYQDVGTKGQ